MTAEEKRDKRIARRQVEQALRSLVRRRIGLYTTPKQERAALRVMVDRFYAEQVTPAARRIESQVVNEANERSQRQPSPSEN